MYVADLHYDGELPEGDLDSGNRKVVIDPLHEASKDEESDLEYNGNDDWILYSLDNPVDLEYIEMPEGYDRDITNHEKGTTDIRTATLGYSFSSTWTPEQLAESERLNAIMEGLEKERNARIIAACKFINKERAEVRRWDDDSYGFLIGTGM